MKFSPRRPGFVNHLLVYTLVGLGASGSVGVGTVWMRHQISLAANENKALEAKIATVERESEQLTAEIAEEQNPAVLLRRNAEWRLGLVPPGTAQIHHIGINAISYHANKERQREGATPAETSVAIRFSPGVDLGCPRASPRIAASA